MKILAVIPARGGSKGLPRKNILKFSGKPLIAWTIEAALQVAEIDKVIVSTDDLEIAEIAREFGAEVPFQRPSSLATDSARGEDVFRHALEEAQRIYRMQFDWVLLLQPTSPLRSCDDIKVAIGIATAGNVDSVVGIRAVQEFPQWMKVMGQDGVLLDYLPSLEKVANRQDINSPFIVNGAIYLVRPSLLFKARGIYSGKTKGILMPRDRSIDIDDILDFKIAECIFDYKRKKNE